MFIITEVHISHIFWVDNILHMNIIIQVIITDIVKRQTILYLINKQ